MARLKSSILASLHKDPEINPFSKNLRDDLFLRYFPIKFVHYLFRLILGSCIFFSFFFFFVFLYICNQAGLCL